MYKKILAIACLTISLHSAAATQQSLPNQHSEPTVAIPVEYAYEGQINKYVEGRRVILEELPTTLLELPVSKVLLDGLKYRLPEIVESSLQKQAINYVDSSKFHTALKEFFEKRSGQKLARFGLHTGFAVLADLPGMLLLSSWEPEANFTGFMLLCFSALMHTAIEFDYKKIMQKKYDPIVAYLLQHKAFSAPQHSSINKYLQTLLLKHYSKEQLKKLQNKHLN